MLKRTSGRTQRRLLRTVGALRDTRLSGHALASSGMLNYIWFGLMAIALVVAAINGTPEAVTKGAVESASTAVTIAIGLVGVMTLWLGMMRVAEAAGLVELLGRALRPLLRWLFPGVPPGHPAGGALVLALAANMLGLNNAATPLGIKAMEELQKLNPDKDSASNDMVTLMAVITAGVQLIPASMIGVLAAAGSTNPTAIIGPTLVATFIGSLAGLLAARLLQRFYPQPPSPAPALEAATDSDAEVRR
jgi:spore maturation protein A